MGVILIMDQKELSTSLGGRRPFSLFTEVSSIEGSIDKKRHIVLNSYLDLVVLWVFISKMGQTHTGYILCDFSAESQHFVETE